MINNVLTLSTSSSSDSSILETLTNMYYSTNLLYTNSATTTSTSTFWNYNYNYSPYSNTLQWVYTQDIKGLREYMFANDLYNEITDILLDIEFIDVQEFEDSLYRTVLDLLYEKVKAEFEANFFNEEIFPYDQINKIIAEIIEQYHNSLEDIDE